MDKFSTGCGKFSTGLKLPGLKDQAARDVRVSFGTATPVVRMVFGFLFGFFRTLPLLGCGNFKVLFGFCSV